MKMLFLELSCNDILKPPSVEEADCYVTEHLMCL